MSETNNFYAFRPLRAGTGFLFLILVMLLLAACSKQELHRDLTENQANEVVAALSEAGISSSKEALEDNIWSVSVAEDDFSQAVQLLRTTGLPRERFDSLGDVFKKEGFTSSPLEERARLIYGLSQELSHTISEIDGVVQARVHLTLPQPDPLSREVPLSSASVFIKYRPGFDLDSQTAAVKSLVANSIEGLSYDKVSVVMVPGVAPVAKANDNLLPGFGWLRWFALVAAIAVTIFAAYHFVKGRKSARKSQIIVSGSSDKNYASDERK